MYIIYIAAMHMEQFTCSVYSRRVSSGARGNVTALRPTLHGDSGVSRRPTGAQQACGPSPSACSNYIQRATCLHACSSSLDQRSLACMTSTILAGVLSKLIWEVDNISNCYMIVTATKLKFKFSVIYNYNSVEKPS